MAASYNIEKHNYIKETVIREVIDKIISDIEYDEMETKLHIFDDYDEEITFGDLVDLLNYAMQFTGGDALTTIIAQPIEHSSNGPIEMKIIAEDTIAAPPPNSRSWP